MILFNSDIYVCVFSILCLGLDINKNCLLQNLLRFQLEAIGLAAKTTTSLLLANTRSLRRLRRSCRFKEVNDLPLPLKVRGWLAIGGELSITYKTKWLFNGTHTPYLILFLLLEVQPQIRGWLLASDGKKTGVIPANYVKMLGKRKGTRHNNEVLKRRCTLCPTVYILVDINMWSLQLTLLQ